MGKTISALTVTLATSGMAGCGAGAWLGGDEDVEVSEPPQQPDQTSFFPPHSDGGFLSVDGGVPVPARLSALIVADRPPPAISGGTLTVSKAGDLAVAADSDRDAIYLIELPEGKVTTLALAEGSEPGRVLLDGARGAHVGLRNQGVVARIDLDTGTISHQTAACQLPRGLAYDAKTDEVLVACASGELVSLDAKTHAERARSFIDLDLRDIVIGKDGQRFVTRYRSAELLAVSADGKVEKTSHPLTTRSTRFETLVGDDGSSTGGPRSVSASATLAWKTISASDGTPVMLHQQSQNDEIIISQAGGYGGGGSCQPITQGGITRYDAEGKAQSPLLLGGAGLAVDMAASADGKWYALAKPGAYLRGSQGSLEVISAQLAVVPQQPQTDAGVDAPAFPTPDSDGGMFGPTAFPQFPSVCNTGMTRGENVQTTAVAFDAQGTLYTFSREPAQLTVYQVLELGFGVGVASVQEIQTVTLSTRSVRDTGHELFHADVGAGLACASCHGEALDDGHVWNFRDFGPRRTQNMRGGLLSTLPLHWEGDMPSFQHLVDEVMTRRMGGFHVEPKFADALAQWIDKQPAIVMPSSDVMAAERGKVLFESAEVACSSCHTGSSFTNNTTVDVGTGGNFQVPSLRGLAMHAPFMHDGCATTLADRFDAPCGGGDKHGKTSQLTREQLADLVAYLETL